MEMLCRYSFLFIGPFALSTVFDSIISKKMEKNELSALRNVELVNAYYMLLSY